MGGRGRAGRQWAENHFQIWGVEIAFFGRASLSIDLMDPNMYENFLLD
jgi:hypothetical protein